MDFQNKKLDNAITEEKEEGRKLNKQIEMHH
jgi:hypothetical protein